MGANEKQQKVIESINGIYIVDAGAGTGKTYTITQRYLEILKQDEINPSDILLVTFTRNASLHMKEKVISKADANMTTELLESPISSFDAFCSKIVANHGLNAPNILGIEDNLSGYKLISESVIQKKIFNKFYNQFLEHNQEKYQKLLVSIPNGLQVQYLIEQLLAKGIYPTKTSWFLDAESKLKGNYEEYSKIFEDLNQPGEGKKGPTQSQLLKKFSAMKKNYLNRPTEFDINKQLDPKLAETSFNDDRGELLEFIHHVYFQYLEYMIKNNLMTFSLISMFAFLILYNSKEVRSKNSFKYVMVDEFQDTNEMQFMLILLLMKESNLCVVGDWKQGIYGFRNATITNIKDFGNKIQTYKSVLNKEDEKILIDVTKYEPLDFDVNYRSSQNILSFSEKSLVTKGSKEENFDIEEVQKQVVSLKAHFDYDSTSTIEFNQTQDREMEIDLILSKIQDLVGKKKIKFFNPEKNDYDERLVSYKDIAVLSRTRTFGLDIQKRAIEMGMPVVYDGGIQIFEEEPSILLLAWLKLLLFKDKRDAWIPILEKEKYSYAQIKHILNTREYPEDILKFRSHLLKNRKIINYIIDEIFKKYHFNNSISNAIISILDQLFHSTLMSISDLITFMEDNIENQETYNIELEGSLDSFRIQTIHGSKGLEYPIVFIVNCNLQSFPSTMSNTDSLTFNEIVGLRSKRIYSAEHEFLFDNWKTDLVNIGLFSDMDEERRLLYVAITRAMYDVYFTSSRPSEFFNSLGEEEIKQIDEVELIPNKKIAAEDSTKLEIKTKVESKNQVLSVHDLMTFKEGQKGRGKEFGTILHKLAFRYIKKLSIGKLGEEYKKDFDHIKTFIDTDLKDAKLTPEIDCSLPIKEHVLIRGIIDLVAEFDDRVEVIDWKSDLEKLNLEEYVKQLSVYYHILKEVYPGKEIKCKIFWTYTGNSEEVSPLSIEDLIKRGINK